MMFYMSLTAFYNVLRRALFWFMSLYPASSYTNPSQIITDCPRGRDCSDVFRCQPCQEVQINHLKRVFFQTRFRTHFALLLVVCAFKSKFKFEFEFKFTVTARCSVRMVQKARKRFATTLWSLTVRATELQTSATMPIIETIYRLKDVMYG